MDIDDVNAVVRVWTVDEIRDRIQNSDTMVEKSLVKMLEKQTEDEKSSEATRYLNGQGFNAKDARFGTILAKVVVSGKHLSPKQIECARRILNKYSGQLTRIANNEAKQ